MLSAQEYRDQVLREFTTTELRTVTLQLPPMILDNLHADLINLLGAFPELPDTVKRSIHDTCNKLIDARRAPPGPVLKIHAPRKTKVKIEERVSSATATGG